jgi:soluble lytic murein transglycosylase
VSAGLLVAVAAIGCRGGSAPESRPPAEPTSVQLAPGSADAGDAGAIAIADGMPRVAVVLDDPRLALARERAEAKDDSAAAREVDRVGAATSLDTRTRCEWMYLSGRLHLSAGEETEAAAAFDRAASPGDGGEPCALAPYAHLREAIALVRAGRYDEAVVAAQSVGDEIAAHDETKLTLADALSCKGDRAGALAIWRAFLAANPHGLRWVDISLQIASALLDGVDGPPAAGAQEALERTTRVVIEAPVTADKLEAATVRQRAATMAKVPLKPFTPEERARLAQAWLDASQPKHAREVADQVLAAVPKREAPGEPHRQAACSAAIVRAQATPHGKGDDPAAAWGAAISRCEKDDALVTALYYGGRASVNARRDAEALERFEKVEKLFPKHRLADDARFRAALVALDQGNSGRALTMLASIPDAYPEGDMGGEALFRVALEKLDKSDLDGARAALDRALLLAPQGPSVRRAEYFRARIAELTGDVDDAKRRYASLVAEAPLDYYMLLAYARLRALDDVLARATLASAVGREPAGPLATQDHPELASPAFERFLSLLEVGELDSARREVSAGGLTADGADPAVLWTVAWLYDHAGAPDIGHWMTRGGRLSEFHAHWPAGRWRLAWEVAFPRAWDSMVTRESDSARIPTALTWAVMREESAFNPEARSVANAIGLMQLMAGTARLVAHDTDLPYDEQALHRPDVSIALGTRLLSELRASFPLHPAFAIAAYNGGSNAVRHWLQVHGTDDFDVFVEHIPFDETRNYVKKVLSSEAAYAYLYNPAALDEILAMPAHLVAPQSVATP